MHDFIVITILDADFAKRRARNDLQIALDSDLGRIDSDFVQHLGDADPARNASMFAIYPDTEVTIETHRGRP